VLGFFGKQGVELFLVALHAEDELLGEFALVVVLQARGEESSQVAQGVLGVEVFLEERLEGDFASAAAAGHGGGMTQWQMTNERMTEGRAQTANAEFSAIRHSDFVILPLF
jgi:hypothetical protein